MLDAGYQNRESSIKNRGEEMPLGYVLRIGEVLAYYGQERKDIAEAIFKYGRDRRVAMTTEPGTLGGTKGQDGFRSPDEILDLARHAMEGAENVVPRRYPSFHGTLGKHSVDRGSLRKAQKGADVVDPHVAGGEGLADAANKHESHAAILDLLVVRHVLQQHIRRRARAGHVGDGRGQANAFQKTHETVSVLAGA